MSFDRCRIVNIGRCWSLIVISSSRWRKPEDRSRTSILRFENCRVRGSDLGEPSEFTSVIRICLLHAHHSYLTIPEVDTRPRSAILASAHLEPLQD